MSDRPDLRVVEGEGLGKPPITRAERLPSARTCLHNQIIVDGRERRVECGDCGVTLDPIAALEQLAGEIDRYLWWVRRSRQEAEIVARSVKDLKRLERNAKARVRNAIRELPPCECESPASYGRFCRDCGGRIVR